MRLRVDRDLFEGLALGLIAGYRKHGPDGKLLTAKDERDPLGVLVCVQIDPWKANDVSHVPSHQDSCLNLAFGKMRDNQACPIGEI